MLSGAIDVERSSEPVVECPSGTGCLYLLERGVANAMWWDGMTRSINYFDSEWGEASEGLFVPIFGLSCRGFGYVN